jgi:transcriptional regulator with XRE-family HTH domain
MSFFFQRLRNARSERGLTMRALGLKAGLGPATVRSLETAKSNPRLATIERLAKALDVDVAWLATGHSAERTPIVSRPLSVDDLYLPTASDFVDAIDMLERDDLAAHPIERLWIDLGEAGA